MGYRFVIDNKDQNQNPFMGDVIDQSLLSPEIYVLLESTYQNLPWYRRDNITVEIKSPDSFFM